MDIFHWNQTSIDPYHNEPVTPDDINTLWTAGTFNDSWKWGEYSPDDYVSDQIAFTSSVLHSLNTFDLPGSSRTSSYGSSQFDDSPREQSVEVDLTADAKALGRPRAPDVSGRDPNENRIQRRRTQNRNSQRVYRQRRIDERNMFEARALTAEENAEGLRAQVDDLQTQVVQLKGRVEELEVENKSLRKGKEGKSEQNAETSEEFRPL